MRRDLPEDHERVSLKFARNSGLTATAGPGDTLADAIELPILGRLTIKQLRPVGGNKRITDELQTRNRKNEEPCALIFRATQ
jgi:hypothetical protein